MPLAEKLRALGQHALRKSRNVAAALSEVGDLFRSEKVRVWRRAHAKFAQKFRERIAKFPEFRHAARRKKCVHSASVRCTTLATFSFQ